MKRKLLNTYPVDTAANIKAASAYFDEHGARFSCADRVKYARELAEVQYGRGEVPTEKVAYYAHAKPRQSFEPAIKIRSYLTGGLADEELECIVKEASALGPIDVVALLDDFDRANNLVGKYDRLPDPFDSVYVGEKTAEANDDSLVWVGPASDRLTKDRLQQWLRSEDARQSLGKLFNFEMVESLSATGGWEIFKSLPDPHKQVIARLANDNVINGTVGPGYDSRSAEGENSNEQLYSSASDRIKRMLG